MDIDVAERHKKESKNGLVVISACFGEKKSTRDKEDTRQIWRILVVISTNSVLFWL